MPLLRSLQEITGGLRRATARNIATVGEIFGLPELGISERVAGAATQTKPFIQTVGGAYRKPVVGYTPISYTPYIPSPALPSPMPVITGGGGGGQTLGATRAGGQPAPAVTAAPQPQLQDLGINVLGEQIAQAEAGVAATRTAPSQAEGAQRQAEEAQRQMEAELAKYDQAYQRALEAIGGYETWLTQSYQPTQIGGIETQAAAGRGRIEAERERGLASYGRQRAGAERQLGLATQKIQEQERSAAAEARRQFAEIQQGMQALYGGTTGTGAFATELAGRSAMVNIANVRGAALTGIAENEAAFQNTVGEITGAENDIRSEAMRAINEIDASTMQQKKEIESEVLRQLTEINLKKGESEAAKSERRMAVLQNIRDYYANIETRQAELEMRELDKAQSYLNQLNMLRADIEARANAQFQMQLREAQIPTPMVSVYTPQQAIAAGQIPSTAQIITPPTATTKTGARVGTKGMLTTLGGRKVLIDPYTGEIIKDYGPAGEEGEPEWEPRS